MKVIVEVGAASAMLGEACHARMALAILANASEVTPSRISKEDVGAKVDGLSGALETPASARKFVQIHRIIDRDEDIGVLWNRLACHQRAHEGNTQDPGTSACSPHEGPYSKEKGTTRFGN